MSKKLSRKTLAIAVLSVASLALLPACDKGNQTNSDAKARLTEYISKSFGAKSLEDKKELITYLTGDARVRLDSWSEDQFRQAFIDSRRQFLKLAFKEEKKVSPIEDDITYEISYLDKARGNNVKVTNKKMSQMVLEKGQWMVRDVHNIKELIEYQGEMSLP